MCVYTHSHGELFLHTNCKQEQILCIFAYILLIYLANKSKIYVLMLELFSWIQVCSHRYYIHEDLCTHVLHIKCACAGMRYIYAHIHLFLCLYAPVCWCGVCEHVGR